ncbi:collagenase-like [Sabethes cyaneus]|uniref:collagenase-like n=1 Tax=Sabethes cyaneus TaxID=53552 RepID=UPI00237EC3DA|nr:collagenase-like [Sabethes cyaneus]
MDKFHYTLVWLLPFLSVVTAAVEHTDEEARVVNGKDAELGQFPYQALLIIHLAGGKGALCGGSLLSDEWVLTAGHCVQDATSFDVTLGAIELKNNTNDGGRVTLSSSEFIQHENYQAGSAANDVAVIKLPSKVTFNDRIQPIKLPTGRDSYAQQQVLVSGFGQQHDNGAVAQKLQYAPLTVIRNTECMLVYGVVAIKTNNICARGVNRESACHGDSGGPLVLEQDHTLVGVVSFGTLLGCERGLPVVYARVTEFRDWIKEKTGI